MKAAICFSGQPRHLDKTLEAWQKYLIGPLKADVFYHFWKKSPPDLHDAMGKPEVLQWNIDYDAINNLGAKTGSVEDQLDFRDYLNNTTQGAHYSIQNTLSMLYSIYKANMYKYCSELRMNMDYHVVIRARTDILLKEPLSFNEIVPGKINIEYRSESGDQFAYGTSKDMDIFSECFQSLKVLSLQVPIHPEDMIRQHAKNNKIELVPVDMKGAVLLRG